jgi:hypothetical protein
MLVKITPDGNGMRDTENQIAISNEEQKLKDYCKEVFGLPTGKPKKFSWDAYYVIEETEIEII